MYLRVRHLNLGTLRPVGGRMVCHALLVEAGERLVLVDTGFGTEDLARLEHVWSGIARRRRSEPYDALRRQLTRNAYTAIVTRPAMDPAQTAIAQVEALGHSAADVTDIVLTHMDLDHAGGLADFPRARVHVDAVEHHHAMAAATARGRSIHRFRYWPYQWAHQPAVTTYARGGDGWHGIDGVRELDGLPGLALVPLPGHSPGHCGVAIDVAGRWLLHAGDTYFDHREIDPGAPRVAAGVLAFQKRLEFDAAARRASRHAVRALAAAVEVFCSHDPAEFERYATGSSTTTGSRRAVNFG